MQKRQAGSFPQSGIFIQTRIARKDADHDIYNLPFTIYHLIQMNMTRKDTDERDAGTAESRDLHNRRTATCGMGNTPPTLPERQDFFGFASWVLPFRQWDCSVVVSPQVADLRLWRSRLSAVPALLLSASFRAIRV
jgi:hypothetical protein